MLLSQHERRVIIEHEDAREREAEGQEPELACVECEDELDERTTHTLQGETFCAVCAVDRIVGLRRDLAAWSALTPAQRLEVLEVIGAAAGELESQLRAAIRAGKAA